MFVTNQRKYFLRLISKTIGLSLGGGFSGHFDGVGIVVVSSPTYPSRLLALYPCFYAPKDPICTISTGALLQCAGFNRVLVDTGRSLHLSHRDGFSMDLPLTTKGDIDYLSLSIHRATRETAMRLEYRHLSLQPASILHPRVQGTVLQSWWFHFKYAHRSISMIQSMIDKGFIKAKKGLRLAPLNGRCPICDAAGATKLPRGPPVDTTELPVGSRFHIDFTFFNVESIRGFTAVFVIVEATTRFLWFFPCRHKNAPIDLCLFFFNHLRRQGLPICDIRTDEDGALVGNTEFCATMYKSLGVVLQSTGGGASTINGTVESPHRTIKRMTRAQLIGSLLSNTLWCFSGQYATFTYNNCINRTTNKPPALSLLKKLVKPSKLHPFGSRVKIIKELKSQRALSARTSGDLRAIDGDDSSPSTISPDELSNLSSFDGRFVGYSNDPAVILVYCENAKIHRIRRVHHAIIDPFGLSLSPSDRVLPHEHLLRQAHSSQFGGSTFATATEWKADLDSCEINSLSSPFSATEYESFTITLPPKGTMAGLSFVTDEDYMLPILYRVHPESPLYHQIPTRHHFCHSWIIQLHEDKPLTAQGAAEAIAFLQTPDRQRHVTISFCPIIDPIRHNYQTYRAVFDSMTSLKHAHMVTLPSPPKLHRTFWDCLDSADRHHWIQAAHAQFHKNQTISLCSRPEPRENVPKDTKVLSTVLAPKIKKKGDDLYEFSLRMCANGSSQQKGIDFDFSWSPTVGASGLRLTLMAASAFSLTIGSLDAVNCFQSTNREPSKRLTIHTPPFYMSWFKKEFPHIKLEHSPSGHYVLQLLKGLQGDKSIGRDWYLLLVRLFKELKFTPCPSEPAVFIYRSGDDLMLACTSTDDILCAYSRRDLFTRLKTHLAEYVDVTTQEGSRIKYLNLDIIQSQHGISYDQSAHIEDTIKSKFFPPDSTSTLKPVHTPFRTDSEFELDLCEELPASSDLLKDLHKRYGGTYPEILGQILHVFVWTRPDLGFACTRLGKYTQGPNSASFAGLYRAVRYLCTHLHRPIIYPRRKIDGYHTIRVNFDPPKFEEIQLPNGLIILVDSDHGRDLRTRRSCHNLIAFINGVAIDWKTAQQKIVSLHSTEAETRGAADATKRGIFLQSICEFIGFEQSHIRPFTLFEDSQPCIDVLQAKTVTTRVKHLAVPIHFVHHHINILGDLTIKKIGTHLNVADSGTKPNSSPVHFRHYDHIIGVRFYPPPGSEHYKLLRLDRFLPSPFTSKNTDTS